MTALYELTNELKEAQSLIANGELSPDEMRDTLDGMVGEFNDKAVNVAHFKQNLNASIDAIDAEIERLNNKKKALKNHDQRMVDYLRDNMEAAGIKKIECPLFTITLRAGQKKAVILDESKLPDDYVSVKTTVKPDSRAILKDLKDGADIPGAILEDGKSSVLIK